MSNTLSAISLVSDQLRPSPNAVSTSAFDSPFRSWSRTRDSFLMVALVCLSLLLSPRAVSAQTDGNFWRALDGPSKGAYAMGFRDAMAASGSFATPRANSGSFATNEECRKLLSTTENKVIGLVLKVTPVQLADALDQLYDDATNRLILLPRAVGIISMQLIGSSDEEVKRMLAFERAMAAGSVPPPR